MIEWFASWQIRRERRRQVREAIRNGRLAQYHIQHYGLEGKR